MNIETAYTAYRNNMGCLAAEYEVRFEAVKTFEDIKKLNDWYEEDAEYHWCEFMTRLREEAE